MNPIILSTVREDILRQYNYYLVGKNAVVAAEKFLAAVQIAIEQISRHRHSESPQHSPAHWIAFLARQRFSRHAHLLSICTQKKHSASSAFSMADAISIRYWKTHLQT